jgi:hypothetical protein
MKTHPKGKVIKNGKVAVAISPDFGAGWVTWNQDEISPFEPKVIKMIEDGKQAEIDEEWCNKNLGCEPYCGGAYCLEIEWVPVGVSFSINEYDGSERLYRSDQMEYTA